MTSLRCPCGTRNRFRSDRAGTLLQCRNPRCSRRYVWDNRGTLRLATEWELDYFRSPPLGRFLMRLGRALAGWRLTPWPRRRSA